jgi:hypothetical protein
MNLAVLTFTPVIDVTQRHVNDAYKIRYGSYTREILDYDCDRNKITIIKTDVINVRRAR